MANPGDFAYTLKQQTDIVRIIGDYVKLKKAGAQNFSGICPFHNEKTPSFSVHQTRQFYHCFGCGVSGDVFSFVQKIENITFPASLEIGNMTRLRNLEYIAETAASDLGPWTSASGFRRPASGSRCAVAS